MRQPDFVLSLNIPVTVPTAEEAAPVDERLEPHQRKLVDEGYLTLEEMVAYMRFSVDLASFAPFFMDEFLKVYRANVSREEEARVVPESRIITPF
jgi:hypothetical protein